MTKIQDNHNIQNIIQSFKVKSEDYHGKLEIGFAALTVILKQPTTNSPNMNRRTNTRRNDW